jgi:hypothetical protein
MSESPTPAPDLFDESPLRQPASRVAHVGAIAPMTPESTVEELAGYVALRWWAAGTAIAVAIAVGYVSHFPIWAVAGLALFMGAMSLWPLPPFAERTWRAAAASFFFAQVTSIFVTPFTWPMRFGFCAVLLIGLTLVRVKGTE